MITSFAIAVVKHRREQPKPSRLEFSFAMSDELHDSYLQLAIDVAKAGGSVILKAIRQPKNVQHKAAVDLVTETDKEVEALIRTRILAAYPSHRFIGEEDSSELGYVSELTDEPTWMVDPVDGTTNFVHGFPFVCVSIGLAINRTVVVGVVYNPVLDELFTAVKGGGACLNGQRIHVSDTAELGKALIATEFGVFRDDESLSAIFDRLHRLVSKARSIRCTGCCSANMCSVACGRVDGFFEIGFGGCWDVAAGSLIVHEAGGHLLDPSGSSFDIMSRRVLCTNSKLAPHISAILSKCKTSSKEP